LLARRSNYFKLKIIFFKPAAGNRAKKGAAEAAQFIYLCRENRRFAH
jgi:hypothetical protein